MDDLKKVASSVSTLGTSDIGARFKSGLQTKLLEQKVNKPASDSESKMGQNSSTMNVSCQGNVENKVPNSTSRSDQNGRKIMQILGLILHCDSRAVC